MVLQPILNQVSQILHQQGRSTVNQNVVVFSCTFSLDLRPLGWSTLTIVDMSTPSDSPRLPLGDTIPQCTGHSSLTWCIHTRCIFAVASACCSPLDYLDVCCNPPFPRMQYTACPFLKPNSAFSHIPGTGHSPLSFRSTSTSNWTEDHWSWGSQRGRGP